MTGNIYRKLTAKEGQEGLDFLGDITYNRYCANKEKAISCLSGEETQK